MVELLAQCFFVEDTGTVDADQWDDPAPRPQRDFPAFSEEELERYLHDTSNTSAPGMTGIFWLFLKWGWDEVRTHITAALACITLGYHPLVWRKALVVVIPKPNQDNYAIVKSYRPISLLECMSKSLEKTISKHLLISTNTD
jgi:hypothetical protein